MDKGYVFRRCVKRFRNRLAVVSGDVRLNYEQLNERVNKLACGLISLGVKKGDRIGLLLLNSHHYIEAEYACAKCGFVMVPLNARLAGPEHAYMLQHSEANTLIFGEEFIDIISPIVSQIPSVKRYICIGKRTPDGTINYEKLLEGQSNAEPYIKLSGDDLSSIRYTSGTTGRPKGVVLTQKNDIASAINQLADNLNPRTGDVMLHVGPVTHASGALILPHFMVGASNVILKEFDPEATLNAVVKEKATTMFLVPTMIIFLLQYPGLASFDLSTIRHIGYGAAPMPVEPLREALKIFGPVFAQGYGLTEAPLQDTLLRKEEHVIDGSEEALARLASAGRELQRIELTIRDDEGNLLPAGEIGEIAVKGDHVMTGYWKDPEATAERLRDGWLYTGDMAFMDEDGYVFIVDRKHDMIISGGFNIYPREVEEVIYRHPAVSQCAVIGVPDDRWGESVKAIVVLKEGAAATAEDIIEHAKRHIASYKKPKSVEFADSIPVNPYGKVMRREIREKYWAGRTRRV